MKQYWVEGLYIPAPERKKTRPARSVERSGPVPFYHSFWAETPADALRQAGEEIGAGTWTDGPRILKTSEEQRMRNMGAPELPLFQQTKAAKKKR